MKKGYIRLLIFIIVISLVLIINSFIWNILNGYIEIIFLIIITIIFKLLFGIEKDRRRYTKNIILDIIIFLSTFLFLYYFTGFFIGFAKTENYYNINGITTFIIPTVLYIIIKEFLRYQIIIKSEGSKLLTIISIIFFIFLDTTNAIYYNLFTTNYDIFIFIALSLLPSISTNITCSYITYKSGYKPNIVYLLIINLYQYLLPIVPNPNEYIVSIITFLIPILLGYKIFLFLKQEEIETLGRDYNKKNYLLIIIAIFIIIIPIYFTSGYFPHYAVAIASGSMYPNISRGDVVIIKKINDNYEDLEKGKVIAYKYNNIIVVHRITNIINDKQKYYIYTKGDANMKEDNYVVEEQMVIGIVKYKIPYIGFPTIWLNEI